jgi:hypothetical protein
MFKIENIKNFPRDTRKQSFIIFQIIIQLLLLVSIYYSGLANADDKNTLFSPQEISDMGKKPSPFDTWRNIGNDPNDERTKKSTGNTRIKRASPNSNNNEPMPTKSTK